MLWKFAGAAFIVAGVLEVSFLLFSVLGVLVGGFMTFGAIAAELSDVEALVGPLVLVFYALWFVATLVSGPLHLLAGAAVLVGRRPRPLLWAAIVGSLVPVITVYCAPTSLLAGILGLVAILSEPKEG